MNSGSVNKRAKGWSPPFWRCCRGMWAAREGTGLRGRRFGGAALHPFPAPSHSTSLQSSFLSPTRWLLGQEGEQGAGGKWGPHLTQQWWQFGNTTPADSSVPVDLNLLRVTPNPHHHDRGEAEHLLRWRVQPVALGPAPPPLSPRCRSAQAAAAV